MPIMDINVPDTSTQITRPAVQGIVSQLMRATGIPADTELLLYSADERVSVNGSTVDSVNRDVRLTGRRRVQVKYKEEYDIDSIGNINPSRPMHDPVFIDTECRFSLSPIYAHKELELEFTLQTQSESEADNWYADFARHTAKFRLTPAHSIDYSYQVPNEFLRVIEHIHRNRTEYDPTTVPLEQYMRAHFSDRVTVLTGMAGVNRSLSISETQVNLWGIFDFDVLPDKPELENELWQIRFTYRVSYQKVIGCRLQYPVMAYNRPLPNEWVAFGNTGYDLLSVRTRISPNYEALAGFEAPRTAHLVRDDDFIARIPYYDDKVLTRTPANTATVMTALCTVDTDKRYVLNLHELGDYAIDDDIMEFITKSEWPYMTQVTQSFLQLHLYRNDYTLPMGDTVLTSDLRFSSRRDLNLADEHRVRFSIVTELECLPKSAFERLRLFPRAAIKIIATINELIRRHPDYGRVSRMEQLTVADLEDIVRLVKGRGGRGVNILSSNNQTPKLFSDIPDQYLENYRKRRIAMMTVQGQYLSAKLMFRRSE